MTLLSRYQQIAATTQDIVTTDIPQSVVGDFADLALKVKDAGIQSVVFDDSVIRPAYPDFDKIRGMVQDALSGPHGHADHALRRGGRRRGHERAGRRDRRCRHGHHGRGLLPVAGRQRRRRLRLRPGRRAGSPRRGRAADQERR